MGSMRGVRASRVRLPTRAFGSVDVTRVARTPLAGSDACRAFQYMTKTSLHRIADGKDIEDGVHRETVQAPHVQQVSPPL